MKAKKFTKETIREAGITQRKFPTFEVGDRIAVSVRIKEAEKERLQLFEGDVISMRNNGISSTFTVRKKSVNSVHVERIFPFYSPIIAGIQFIRKGKVRRAKLYYLRERVGKAANIAENRLYKDRTSSELQQETAGVAESASAVE